MELDFAVVDLTGQDAREWLQGQVTQDLRTLPPGGSVRACLCKPTGQLLAHLEVWDLGEALRLLIHQSELPAFLTRVEEAVIVEEVEATVLRAQVLHAYGKEFLSFGSEARARSRTGLPGFDIVTGEAPVTHSAGEGLSSDGEGIEAKIFGDQGLFDALTLAAGEPIPGADTNEKTLPPELGPAFEAATTSYRKGCYTGQEVLMRLHSRGHTNRTWRGLLSPVPLGAGMRVLAEGVEVGRVTRAAVHPTLGPIAAAFLRREADGKALTIEMPDGPAVVQARDLPLSSE